MLGGDPADLTALSQRLSAAAESVDHVASSTVRATVWQGKAATAHETRLDAVLDDLALLRADAEAAAEAVAHLASVVVERQQFLLDAWNAARNAAAEAADAAGDGAQRAWAYAEDAGGWAKDRLEDVKFW